MRYLSVCSGIEAATQAWHPLGWKPVAFSEIEPFPCAVLKHHYPDVPNWGDMTKFEEWPNADVDVLCGGTPCQSFSVAGLRKGLADPRGNLMLTFGAIAARYRPRWLVWENVPGVLSSNGGRDFGAFLGMLGQLGYGVAYRVLDAQHVRTRRFPFAVPQRRRRVFVVGYLGDWRRAAAVLFDRESLSGHPPPRREAGKGFAADVAGCLVSSGRGVERTGDTRGQDPVVAVANSGQVGYCLTASAQQSSDAETETLLAVAPTIVSNGDAHTGFRDERGLVPIAFAQNSRDEVRMIGGDGQVVGALGAQPGMKQQAYIAQPWAVRRLTPTECERLQGFPDGFTRIPYRGKPADQCPDGPRYKALGNSWAVNCAEWIGDRLAEVETYPATSPTTAA